MVKLPCCRTYLTSSLLRTIRYYGTSRKVRDRCRTERPNAELMAMENASAKFDIRERFWKAWLIDTLIQKGNDVTALKETMNIAKSIDLISKEEQKAWFPKTTIDLNQDSIQYQPWDEAAATDFDEQQAFFDSEDYQRENLQERNRKL